ncbi:hypothetical protein HHI36_012573 [Cryptolaemus montrouzieri]|uniref:Uncharacterized protein n=1 Tax=Cryptolaemus montrouzieri TaxID=559131 RepID=A0ABD2NEZ6_9CUCU
MEKDQILNPESEENTITAHTFIGPHYHMYLSDTSTACVKLLDEFERKEKINDEALKYIAGYEAYKFKNEYRSLRDKCSLPVDNVVAPHDWIEFFSREGLLTPSGELLEAARILDAEIYTMHGTTLSKEKHIFRKLAEKTMLKLSSSVPYEVVLCLSRTRTYIRLRDMNKKISFQNFQAKMNKKLSKFPNCKMKKNELRKFNIKYHNIYIIQS